METDKRAKTCKVQMSQLRDKNANVTSLFSPKRSELEAKSVRLRDRNMSPEEGE